MILMPAHFVKAYLSNGIIFDNESIENQNQAKKVQDKCSQLLEALTKNLNKFRDIKASLLGSLVIYCARK